MNCPRCAGGAVQESAYRGGFAAAPAVQLVGQAHPVGREIARCPSCRGTFVEYETLLAIESAARRDKKRLNPREAARRGYDPPTEEITCPSCHSETTRREWSIGTMVMVDVCLECRGVWLDAGELEILGG